MNPDRMRAARDARIMVKGRFPYLSWLDDPPGPNDRPYGQFAGTYRRTGWPGVLPLPYGSKQAPPRGTTGHGRPDPTDAQIRSWEERIPSGNIGLRLPDGVIGIDVDAYGGRSGRDTLAELEGKLGPLPPTWISTSRDDGISGIRFYRVPEGLAWKGVAGPGIDIIQRQHRYAVVWPSSHPEGRRYRWLDPNGEPTEQIPKPSELPELS